MKNRIKQLRKSKNMTQDELAEKTGTSKQQIWYLEKGYRKLTQDWIIKISKALDCSVTDIIGIENKQDITKDEFSDLTDEEKNLIRTFRKIKENESNEKNKKIS